MIEPDDIHNPERLAQRMAEIAAHLAMSMPTATGTSTFCAAVAQVADALGRWPTYAELTKAGYGHAVILLRKPETAVRVASEIGHALRHQKGIWSEERIVAGFAAWADGHGKYPTGNELVADGLQRLHGAGCRVFAGRAKELRSLVEQRCGKLLPRCRAQQQRRIQPTRRPAATIGEALGHSCRRRTDMRRQEMVCSEAPGEYLNHR